MAEEPKVQEVLRLSIEAMEGGLICCRELAFFETHEVFGRVSRREDDTECPFETTGWQEKGKWKDLGQLELRAARCEKEGWTVIWNPIYSPGMQEFRKVAEF